MINSINEFLLNEKGVKERINKIAKWYKLSDFIMFTPEVNQYYKDNTLSDESQIKICFFNIREDFLLSNLDRVEQRLVEQYLSYLNEIMTSPEEIDKTFYLVAFHYLCVCQQYGFELTVDRDSLFPFTGKELSPLGKTKLREYDSIMPFISEEDLVFYNRTYYNYIFNSHATKYLSLLKYMIGGAWYPSSLEFDNDFLNMLDLFIFRYKAIFTTKQINVNIKLEELNC